MFGIGWTELLLILVVVLVVVGPKDLPRIVRSFGQWSGKARAYARDFQRTIEEMADENEMGAIRKEIEEANRELAQAQTMPVNLDAKIDLGEASVSGDPQVSQFAGQSAPASASPGASAAPSGAGALPPAAASNENPEPSGGAAAGAAESPRSA
jgi:sec-independent protein translocase protein TatB